MSNLERLIEDLEPGVRTRLSDTISRLAEEYREAAHHYRDDPDWARFVPHWREHANKLGKIASQVATLPRNDASQKSAPLNTGSTAG